MLLWVERPKFAASDPRSRVLVPLGAEAGADCLRAFANSNTTHSPGAGRDVLLLLWAFAITGKTKNFWYCLIRK